MFPGELSDKQKGRSPLSTNAMHRGPPTLP
jgi:hypothetical protein